MYPPILHGRRATSSTEPVAVRPAPIARFARRERRASQRRNRRRGASTVEFAFVAPIFFFVVLALVQFASLLMSQNVLTAAAREGGRAASLPGTDSSDAVVAAVEERLSRGGIDPDLATVTVTPTTLAALQTGDEVRVMVSAPMASMVWIWPVTLPAGANLSSEVTYDRE